MSEARLLTLLFAVFAALAFNFVPTLIAFARRHPERQVIGQLNILSLLSILLWIALFAWAVGGKRDDSIIGRFVGRPGQRRRLAALVVVLIVGGLATTAYALATRAPGAGQ